MKNILSEIRVLDFTRVLSGPYATRILADFGAQVIKVQSKKIEGTKPDNKGYFDTWNRNKRSISLDMSNSEARKIALRLVAISDVVIENFSPRVMSNWGMDYPKLKKTRSDIIMLSMSGMGRTGLWKDHVAFGPTVQSLGGLTYLSSFTEDDPIGPGYALADHISGLYGAFAVLAALENRDRTGLGQFIDLSQYEVVAGMIGPALLDVFANGHEAVPQGNQPDYEMAAPHGCYQCTGDDRWCVIGIFNETQWSTLVRVMGDPDWAYEKRFSTLEARKVHFKPLDEKLNLWTRKQDVLKLIELLQEKGVPAGVVQNAEDLANDPHLLDQNYFVETLNPSLGKTISDRSPIRFMLDASTDPCSDVDLKSSPFPGEANEYVYKDLLNLTQAEYKSYIQRGIIA
jgi:benzylsuccinate CoA-transferase BbsF subunit